jgi:CheY-like chemotaxis protein
MKGCDVILLIEDDPEDALLIKLAYERLQIDCLLVSVRDGLEALEYLDGQGPYTDRAQFPFPSLILLDLRMPRMDGFEFLEWLRIAPFLQSLPVIVITGSAASQDVTRAYRAGANSFLVKSGDLAQFAAELKQTLSFWLTDKEPLPKSTMPNIRPAADGPPIEPKA